MIYPFRMDYIDWWPNTEIPQDRKRQKKESRWNWNEEHVAVQNCSEFEQWLFAT